MAASQQQTEAAPESVWFPFIQQLYPNLLTHTHFLPPVHFNRTPQDVVTLAGQTVLVRDNPPSRGRRRKSSTPSSPSSSSAQGVAGSGFVENPLTLQPLSLQESVHRDDDAQRRCLQALTFLPGQVMMVISTLEFQKYLSAHTNPLHPAASAAAAAAAAAAARLPSCQDASIPKDITNGECDILILHRQFGLVIAEIKSVGGNEFFRGLDVKDQAEILERQVRKACGQVRNQERVLRHLVKDLPHLRVTKTLMLPNVPSALLKSVLVASSSSASSSSSSSSSSSTSAPSSPSSSSSSLLQTLCDALSVPADVSLAVGHCLCQEDLSQPGTWWQTIHTAGPDQVMTDEIYQRLVARFCGPATTVDIPTASSPRKVVRSLGQAVAETGLRFSSLALTPPQVTLLTRRSPEPRFLFLLGPPGTGKTVVLLLKALQWLRQGLGVILACGDKKGSVVTFSWRSNCAVWLSVWPSLDLTPMRRRRRRRVGVGVRGEGGVRFQRLCYEFRDHGFCVEEAVCRLKRMVMGMMMEVKVNVAGSSSGSGSVLVVFDEVDNGYREEFVQWLREAHSQLPTLNVWAAGIWRLERGLVEPLPPWLEVQTLQEALRCPPEVVAQLHRLSIPIQAGYVLGYTDPQHPVATSGIPVRRMRHRNEPGHSGDYPWQCVTCSDDVADVICRQLCVGQAGEITSCSTGMSGSSTAAGVPQACDPMVERLQQRHALPLWVVTSRLPGEADARELALAVTDRVTVTHWTSVQGLERRVIFALGTERFGRALHSQSRCSGFLCVLT